MKICFICNEYPPAAAGGIGTFTRGLARALVARKHEVHVVGNYDLAAPARETIDGVQVHRLPAARGRAALVLNRLRIYRELAKIAAAGSIDIIEHPDFEGAGAWLPRQSIARIVRLHGSHVYFSAERNAAPSRSVASAERRALWDADAIVSVSDYTAHRTKQLFQLERLITTIHNAVETDRSLPRKEDYSSRGRIVYFGTLAEKKGVLALADAWREFSPAHPDWRLELIGRDSQFGGRSVRELAEERMGAATATATFSGPATHDALMRRLPEFDFAVLPSYSEAFALAPMEAMALGVPVVFSSMSSGPELIEDGVDGWLCDPRSVESVVTALQLAASDEARRARIARVAKAKVETAFSYDAFVQRNIDFYTDVLKQGRRG